MPRCETCKQEFPGNGRFCSPVCHPEFGRGGRHAGTRRAFTSKAIGCCFTSRELEEGDGQEAG